MNRKFTSHPKHQPIPSGSFFLWDHLTLGHSERSSNKHVCLGRQTSRQPVHLYHDLPRGSLHLVLVFDTSFWKDGSNLLPIRPALPQLALWGKSSLLLHVGKSYSGSFLNARPKEDPASLNWFFRPPLTLSYPADPNKQFADPQAFWAWKQGSFACLPMLCMLRVVLNWCNAKPFWRKRAERRIWYGWGRMWQL